MRLSVVVAAVSLSIIGLSQADDVRASIKRSTNIPPQALGPALQTLAKDRNFQVVYVSEEINSAHTRGAVGEFTSEEALKALLSGTGLTFRYLDDKTVTIVLTPTGSLYSDQEAAGEGDKDQEASGSFWDRFRVAQVVQGQTSGTSTVEKQDEQASKKKPIQLEEVLVTGTHIRGVDSASPTSVYTREDIDATGSTTVQQFLQTVPQNFGGGAGEGTVFTGGGTSNNQSWASAANLRGLGNTATLVLINGHRVAPGNVSGNFVDLSMIPLTAIERIEVVTDGASAIYGSDAVGGVINILLRSNFEGADTHVEYGSGDSDSHRNLQLGQTVGHQWGSGSAVVSYQYFDQTPLTGDSRSYSQSAAQPWDLLPEQVQHAVFASFDQQVMPGLQIVGDAMYSKRDSYSRYTYTPTEELSFARVEGAGASFGLKYDLPHRTQLKISADYSESDTRVGLFLNNAPTAKYAEYAKSAMASLNANVDGVLATLPAGAIHYAIGAQYRRETYGLQYPSSATEDFFPTRDVGAGYVELHVPLIGPNHFNGAEPGLEVTAADREEHYSDFGSTNNPEFGVVWKPLSGLRLRGTWGTSFQTPQLYDLNPVPSQVVPYPISDPSKGGNCAYSSVVGGYVGGCTTALLLFGGNPNLGPQNATTWSLGLDFSPVSVAGFTARLTYYNLVIKKYITNAAVSLPNLFDLGNESIAGPAVYQTNPSSAILNRWLAEPTYMNFLNLDPSKISVIVDSRDLNLSIYKTSGLDFNFDYKASPGETQIETGLDGTYVLHFDRQFTSTAPTVSLVNTEYNPVDLRLRAKGIITQNHFTGGLYLNFTSSYSNTNVTPTAAHVASWTTADAFLSYAPRSNYAYFNGLSLWLSVINLAGRAPPFVKNNSAAINYDGANANPLGRFLSIRVSKRW